MESMNKGENKKDKNKYAKMSSSGRLMKPPKRILTSSSDKAPKRKKKCLGSKSTMHTEIDRLRRLVKEMNDVEGKEKSTDTSSNKNSIFIPSENTNI